MLKTNDATTIKIKKDPHRSASLNSLTWLRFSITERGLTQVSQDKSKPLF